MFRPFGCTVAIVACVGGFVLGFLCNRTLFGHYYEIRDRKIINDGKYELEILYLTDREGFPFLDPGKTELILKNDGNITIYKSEVMFQEGKPFLNNVKVNGDIIGWDDGINSYRLHVTKQKTPQQVDSAGASTIAVPPSEPSGSPR